MHVNSQPAACLGFELQSQRTIAHKQQVWSHRITRRERLEVCCQHVTRCLDGTESGGEEYYRAPRPQIEAISELFARRFCLAASDLKPLIVHGVGHEKQPFLSDAEPQVKLTVERTGAQEPAHMLKQPLAIHVAKLLAPNPS